MRDGRSTGLASPQATRLALPRWLDFRLALGVVLVLGSVLVGARVVATADDTVPVLVAAQDLAPGAPLTASMVQTRQVSLESGVDLYLSGEVPAGWVVSRPVGAGEIVPASAVVEAHSLRSSLRYLTVALPAAELPAGLAAGDGVDVWVAPGEQAAERAAGRLLAGVTVTAVEGGSGALGVTGTERPVTLALQGTGPELEASISRLVAAARDGLVYLAAVPSPGGAP